MAVPTRQAPAERWLPSTRSILLGLLLAVGGIGAYFGIARSSVFAIRTIEVPGVPPGVAAKVREELAPSVGSNLIGFDTGAAARRLIALPQVASAQLDRSFPNTLRVLVKLEVPVAVLRQGSSAWVVSARDRILRELTARPYPALPRIWVTHTAALAVNSSVTSDLAPAVASATALIELRLSTGVRSVAVQNGSITAQLASGGEIRLGDDSQLRLKLAIARRILSLAGESAYVDVSVPDRPVSASNPQVGG